MFLFFFEQEGIQKLFDSVRDKIYSLDNRERQLGLGDKGVTTYFSNNCIRSDAEKVNRWGRGGGGSKKELLNGRIIWEIASTL